LLIVNSTKP